MNEPPNEKAGSQAQLSHITSEAMKLADQLRQINNAVSSVWTSEGWRLFSEYQRSGDARHLNACARHVYGIHRQLGKRGGQLK